MKLWFRALYSAVSGWFRYIPERIESKFERPQIPLPVERPPAPRRVVVLADHSCATRRAKGQSIGQRSAGKRRAFVQSLRRDA